MKRKIIIGVLIAFLFVGLSQTSSAINLKNDKLLVGFLDSTDIKVTVHFYNSPVSDADVTIYIKEENGNWNSVWTGTTGDFVEMPGSCVAELDYQGTFKVEVNSKYGLIESKELSGKSSYVVLLDYSSMYTKIKGVVMDGRDYLVGAPVKIYMKDDSDEWELIAETRTENVLNYFCEYVPHKDKIFKVVADNGYDKIESKELSGKSSYYVVLNYDPLIKNRQIMAQKFYKNIFDTLSFIMLKNLHNY